MATTQTETSGTTGTRTSSGATQQAMMGQTPDTTYNLISVMYHTLQGCQTYEQYAQDAEQAGHQDVAQFFRDTGREFERCAQRGQLLLAQCLQQGQMGQGSARSGQLNSQMSKPSGQHGHGGAQQSQMGGASGQQGSSSGTTNRGSSSR
jgi:hypothetical protein